MTRWILLPALGVLAVALAAGCSTGAVGVDACKQIEEARCRQIPSCPSLSLQPLYSPSGSAVDACIRYYDVDCLHGLAVGSEPSQDELTACVAAIQMAGACATVADPQTNPACAWLVPPAEVESGADADASEGAAGDASDGGDGE